MKYELLILAAYMSISAISFAIRPVPQPLPNTEKAIAAVTWSEFFWTTESTHASLVTTKPPEMMRKSHALLQDLDKVLKEVHTNVKERETAIANKVHDTYLKYLIQLGHGSCREEAKMKLSAIKDVTLNFFYNCPFKLSNPKFNNLKNITKEGENIKTYIKLSTQGTHELCLSVDDATEKEVCKEIFNIIDEESRFKLLQELVEKFKQYAAYYVEFWLRKTRQHCFDEEVMSFDFYSVIKDCEDTPYLSYYS